MPIKPYGCSAAAVGRGVLVGVGVGIGVSVGVGVFVVVGFGVSVGSGLGVGATGIHCKYHVSLGGLTAPTTSSPLPWTMMTRQYRSPG